MPHTELRYNLLHKEHSYIFYTNSSAFAALQLSTRETNRKKIFKKRIKGREERKVAGSTTRLTREILHPLPETPIKGGKSPHN